MGATEWGTRNINSISTQRISDSGVQTWFNIDIFMLSPCIRACCAMSQVLINLSTLHFLLYHEKAFRQLMNLLAAFHSLLQLPNFPKLLKDETDPFICQKFSGFSGVSGWHLSADFSVTLHVNLWFVILLQSYSVRICVRASFEYLLNRSTW